jgi:hypothetical protein
MVLTFEMFLLGILILSMKRRNNLYEEIVFSFSARNVQAITSFYYETHIYSH